jgi:hypothetical protein
MSLPTEPTADDVEEWLDTPAVTAHGFERGEFERAVERGEDYSMSVAFDPECGESSSERHDFFDSDAVEIRSVCVNSIWEEHGGVFVPLKIRSPTACETFSEYLYENIFNGGDMELEESGDRVEFRSYHIGDDEIRRIVNDDRACLVRVYAIEDYTDGVAVQVRDTEQ